MIDYEIINSAIKYYDKLGYQRIEAPWLVTKAISDITKPERATTYLVHKDTNPSYEKAFVASGEQSFLYLINKGYLPKTGKFQTVTPCMRNDEFDETHTKYFMKLELIFYSTEKTLTKEDVGIMSDHAYVFFDSFRMGKNTLHFVGNDPISFDIAYNGVEIGSYGLRECSFCNWVYGTGVAEPRFSRLIGQKYDLSSKRD